jgi:hypothetical protein
VTIPVSTVPAAQAAIFEALAPYVVADADSQDILVCIGQPSTEIPSAIIEIGKEIRRTAQPAAFVGSGGAGFIEESYDIDIVVSVAGETVDTQDDPTTIADRAWQLVGYVEDAVRSDPSLGNVVQVAYPHDATGGEVVWAPNNVGRICEITVIIHAEALI